MVQLKVPEGLTAGVILAFVALQIEGLAGRFVIVGTVLIVTATAVRGFALSHPVVEL